jgi:hypothetical protein
MSRTMSYMEMIPSHIYDDETKHVHEAIYRCCNTQYIKCYDCIQLTFSDEAQLSVHAEKADATTNAEWITGKRAYGVSMHAIYWG